MSNQEEPALTLDRALWYGKMCREHSASTAAEISPQFLKRLQKSQTKKPPTFLCLRTGGLIQDVSWDEDSASLGEFSTRSFLEYHNGGVESRLSQILQGGQLQKYYLSAKACHGILNRAARRGKELPEMLRIALEQQAQSPSANEPDAQGGGKGILIQDDQTGTLSTVNNQSVCYPINTMVASRNNSESRTTFGVGDDGDAQFTLSAAHEHAVCYCKTTKPHNKDEAPTIEQSDISPTLNQFDTGDTRSNTFVIERGETE